MSRKFIKLAFFILLLSGLAFGMAMKDGVLANATQAETSAKIEGMLLDKFTSEGTADFIVSFSENADLSSAYTMDWVTRGQFVYDTLTATAQRVQAHAKSTLDGFGYSYKTFIAGNQLYVFGGNLEAANAVAALPEVSSIRATRVWQIEPVTTASSPLLTARWAGDLLAEHAQSTVLAPTDLAWGIVDTKADQFWSAYGVEGAGVVVANIDTGVDYTHIALAGNFKCAANPSDPACWEDPTNNCPGNTPCDAWPGVYHGTHTMGTMVGSNDPALTHQVGMSPDSQWIACLGCPSGGCPDINLNTCADWILAPGGDPNNRPNVVNNSWGGGGGNTFYLTQVQSWVAAGVFPAFSAGNSYSCSSLGSPGDYQESFGSAAHASNRVIAGFSSKGPSAFGHDPYTKPNISAPGVDVMSAMPGDGWQLMSGTSMASPHTAGAVALLWSCNPGLVGQIDQTFQILQNNVDAAPAGDCGAPPDNQGNYTYGYGYLDVLQAGSLWCGDIGTLAGTVTDAATANPIEGAKVHAVGQFGGGPTAITDLNGHYTMDAIVGTYDVTASHPHYMAETVTGLEVISGTTTTQNFALTPRGWVFGIVTDFDNATPIVGATVSADDGQSVETDATGSYQIYLDPGVHTITAVAPDYAEETAQVTIASGVGVEQNFALQAAVVFIPSPIDVNVPLGGTLSEPATIMNRMANPYAFEFREKNGGYLPAQKISIPAFTGEIEKNPAPASIGPAPTGLTPLPSTNQSGILVGPPAYGVDANAANYYNWPDLEAPGTWNLISAVPGTAFFGGDFLNGDFSIEYALDYNSNSLYTIDTATGALTLIGPSQPGGGESWTGMTGAVDGTMYASATTCGSSTLYTVDVTTGALTTVGPITNGACIIDIAINADGNMFGVDIVTDNLIQIDPATGAGTVIGSVGVDANYAQDLTFDQSTGILYWASWNWSVFGGELRIIDTTTGNSVSVGAFPGNAEVDAFAIPTGGSADVPWLSEVPISGTVPGDGSLPVTINFDASPAAGVTQPGTYLATLTVSGTPKVKVPVSMFVEAPADWGRLDGTVNGLGYCDANPAVLEGATVDIVGAVTLTTDAAGYYATWLPAGVYEVNVTAADHTSATQMVTVVAGQNVSANFDLRWLKPCLEETPATLQTTLNLGQTDTQQITLTNFGAGAGNFEMTDRETSYTPMRKNFLPPAVRPANPDTTPSSIGRDPNAKAISPSDLGKAIAQMVGEPAFAMDVYPGYNLVHFFNDNPGVWEIIANEPGSAYFGGDFINGDFSTLYVVDYNTNTLYSINTANGAVTTIGPSNPGGGEFWTGLTGAVDGTMYGVASACGVRSTLFTVDLTSGALTTIGDITNGTCMIDIAATPDGAIYGVDIVNDNLLSIDPLTGAGTIIGYIGFNANYAQGMDYEETTGTLYLAAYSSSGELRIADPATGNTTVVGAFPGGAEVDDLAFATGGGGDAPWLTELPEVGVVPAAPLGGSTTQNVNVTFDAGMVAQPGVYTGEVKANTDDPVVKSFTVNVTMNVNAPADWGKLSGTVTGLGYCDANPAPLKGAEVAIAGGITVKTDANGNYLLWLPAGSHGVTVTADEHEIGNATVVINPGGQMTVQNFDLRWLKPCVTVDPTSLTSTLDMGGTEVQQLTLINSGAGELVWQSSIGNGNYIPTMVNDVLVVAWDQNAATAMEAALTTLGVTYDQVTSTQFESMTVDQLLEYTMVFYAGIPYTNSITLLEAYLDVGGRLYVSDNDVGYSCQFGGCGIFYSDYLQATYNQDDGGSIVTGMDIMDGLTVDVTSDPYPDGFTVGAEGVQIFTWDASGLAGGDAVARGEYKLVYTSFDFQYISSPDTAVELVDRIMAYLGGGGVNWLFSNPTSGVIPPDSTFNVDVTFDTTLLTQPGTYLADLKVKSNDPVNASVVVPTTLNVNGPATWGRVEGIVSSLGYCDQNPSVLAKAIVTLDGTLALETDAAGHYSTWIVQGPHELVVTADGHVQSSATVTVVAQTTTFQDFGLRWLAPCMSETPATLEITLTLGETAVRPITLVNDGAASATFKATDKDLGFTPAKINQKRTGTNGIASNNAQAFPVVPSTPSFMATADVLLIQDSQAWGSPAITTILDNNAIAYDLINSSQISGWDFSIYKMIITPSVQGQFFYDNINANMAKFEEFIDGGGLMLMSVATQGESVNIPFGGTNPWNGQSYNWILDTTYPIFAGVDNPYWGNYASHNAISGVTADDIVLVTTGDVPGGEPVMIERYMGGGLLVVGGQTFEFGWSNGQGAGTILANMIPYYYTNFQGGADALWLTESPITGTVAPDGASQVINVTFDTSQVADLGTYQAEVRVKTDDPVNGKFIIPVTMHIVTPTAPVVSFTSDAPVLVGTEMVFTNTSFTGYPNAAQYEWDFGDGTTLTVGDTDPVTHVFTNFGTFTVTLTACNVVACDSFTADVVVLPRVFMLPLVQKP